MSANSAGRATALTILTPIRHDREARLTDYLQGLTHATSPLAKLSATHLARWVVIKDFVQAKGQPHEDTPSGHYLLFTSNIDSTTDDYLADIATSMADAAAAIWSCCIGCPDPPAGEPLIAYLRHNLLNTGFFYSAYPDATVADVQDSLDVRQRLTDLVLRTQGQHGEAVRSAFLAEFGA